LKPLSEGRLKGDVLLLIRDHIASCAACRSGLDPMALVEILPALDKTIEPSEDFGSRFYAELEMRRRQSREEKSYSSSLITWMSGWRWRLATAGVMTILVAGGFYLQQSRRPVPDTSAIYYEIEVSDDNLQLLQDMALFDNLELFENLDAIENMPQLN